MAEGPTDAHFTILGRSGYGSTLENGAKFTLIEDISAASCYLTVRVAAGSECDPPDLAGLSTFVALALRRGSANYPGAHNLEKFIKKTDSVLKTDFYDSHIDFHCSTEFKNLAKILHRLSDAMALPTLSNDSVSLIAENLETVDQRTRYSAKSSLSNAQFDVMGLPTIDLRAAILARNLSSRARDFIPRHYTPKNMHLILVVNRSVSREWSQNIIERNFKDVFDQSVNVSSALMEPAKISQSRNAFRWHQSLQGKIPSFSDKLSAARAHPHIVRGPRPVSFEVACGQQPRAPHLEPGWGASSQVGGSSEVSADEFSGDIVTVVPVVIDSPEKTLILQFKLDSDCTRVSKSALHIWPYVVGREDSGSLRHSLKRMGLIESLRADVQNWGIAGMFFGITVVLTPSGFARSEYIAKTILEFVQNSGDNLEITQALYEESLTWREIELHDSLVSSETEHKGWLSALTNMGMFGIRDNESNEEVAPDTYEFRYIGELLCPSNCVVYIASSTFYNIASYRPGNLSLRFKKSLVNLRRVLPNERLKVQQQGIDLPQPNFDLIATRDNWSKSRGFVQVSSSPFSAQLWFSGMFVSTKLALPLTNILDRIPSEVAGRLLAIYLNTRLWPMVGKRFRASAEFAHSVLTLQISSSPDDLKHIVRLVFDLMADRSSPFAQADLAKSVEQYRRVLIVDELAPNFELGFEEAVHSRNVLAELQALDKDITLDDLASVTSGYFAMLLVGNVRYAHTLETSNLVGQLLGNDAGVAYHRPVPNLDLPTEIFNVTGHRTLSEHSSDGCGILRAFDLGPTGPGSLCLASVMANYAYTVLEQDLKVGHMYTSEANLRAVNMRGHIWFVVEIVGLREIRYVEPKLNRSLFVSMKDAFADINEQDMKAARNRVLRKYFERRTTADEELERMWEPIATEGVAYDHAIWVRLHTLFARDVANWFNRCVLTRETRRCVRVTYSNRAVEESRPLDEDDISHEDRVRRRPDSDDEEHVQVSVPVSNAPQDPPQDEDSAQDSEDIGTDSSPDSSSGEGSEGQLDE